MIHHFNQNVTADTKMYHTWLYVKCTMIYDHICTQFWRSVSASAALTPVVRVWIRPTSSSKCLTQKMSISYPTYVWIWSIDTFSCESRPQVCAPLKKQHLWEILPPLLGIVSYGFFQSQFAKQTTLSALATLFQWIKF